MGELTQNLTHPAWYIALTVLLALVPLILGTTTSYLKLSLALGVLRNGFGAQQVPNNTIIMVLSLVLSIFIMQPTAEKVIENFQNITLPSSAKMPTKELILPYLNALGPWSDFLRKHSGAREITVLQEITLKKTSPHTTQSGVPPANARILIPAFVLTELKEGLMIGFILLLPFLIIDLAVANILAGLGMYMMSPTIISLPLKLLLFVSVDGWLLISRGFIASYSGVA